MGCSLGYISSTQLFSYVITTPSLTAQRVGDSKRLILSNRPFKEIMFLKNLWKPYPSLFQIILPIRSIYMIASQINVTLKSRFTLPIYGHTTIWYLAVLDAGMNLPRTYSLHILCHTLPYAYLLEEFQSYWKA